MIALPFLLNLLGLHINATAFVIYPNGTVILLIVYKFIKLFDSLKHNEPFCDNNVKLLRSAGRLALIGSFLWIIDLLYQLILAKAYDIVFIVILVFLAALFFVVYIALYILSELFKEAVEYKKENELTI